MLHQCCIHVVHAVLVHQHTAHTRTRDCDCDSRPRVRLSDVVPRLKRGQGGRELLGLGDYVEVLDDDEEEESSEGACSDECSSATKSVFTGCDANDSTEASLKTNVRNWVFKNRFEWEQGRMQFGSWRTGICKIACVTLLLLGRSMQVASVA